MHAGDGYAPGVEQGLKMLDECIDLGIQEVSVYGFTQDNTKRPSDQTAKFSAACVDFATQAIRRDIDLMVLGDCDSPAFPEPLCPFANRRVGGGKLKVNMLVNYGWKWDLETALERAQQPNNRGKGIHDLLASSEVSRIDMIVRWGGCRRLSGFLPVQSVYADFYVVDQYWPDYEPEQFYDALRWYERQDVTLGG